MEANNIQKKSFEPFPKQALVFTCLQYKSSVNTMEKGEIARNEQFLLFPVFSTYLVGMGTSNRLIEYSIERPIIE